MNFNEWMMQKRDKRLEEIEKLKKELENFPEGSLIFQSRGRRIAGICEKERI